MASPNEVFLSHSSQDRDMANEIQRVLNHHGIPVWYSPSNIVGAQQWHDEIGRALARCDWFLILLSPDALRSPWVKRELMYALRHDRYDGRILPIRFRDVGDEEIEAFSWTLFDFQMVSLGGDMSDGFRAVLRTWGVGLDADVLPNRQ
jgi:hypothetical protein